MADRQIRMKITADVKKAQADIKTLKANLQKLSNVKVSAISTNKMTRGMKNLGKETQRTTTQMNKLGGRINAALNIAIVLGFTNALAKAGDQIVNTTNQLKAVGVETKLLNKELAFVLKTSNATRTSVSAIATVYTRVRRSVDGLGYSTAQTQKATTAIAQSFQLAGATAQEATNSTIQLAQGLASGALRGDELRSVLEGNNVLSRAIAKEMGVTVGELRKMGAEGKITSNIVMKALLNDADDMNSKFAKLKPTFENSFQVFQNGLSTALGETTNILGDAIGIKEAFIDVGKSLTSVFLDGTIKAKVGELVRDFREGSAQIKGFFAGIFDNLGLDIPELSDLLTALGALGAMRIFGNRGLRGKVSIDGADNIQTKLNDLRSAGNLYHGKEFKAKVGLTGANTVVERMNSLNTAGNMFHGKKFKAKIGLEGNANKLDNLIQRGNDFNGKVFTAKVSQVGAGTTVSKLGDVIVKGNELNGRNFTAKIGLTGLQASLDKINNITSAGNGFRGKSFKAKLELNTVVDGNPIGSGGAPILLPPNKFDTSAIKDKASKMLADAKASIGKADKQLRLFTDNTAKAEPKIISSMRNIGSSIRKAFDGTPAIVTKTTIALAEAEKSYNRIGNEMDNTGRKMDILEENQRMGGSTWTKLRPLFDAQADAYVRQGIVVDELKAKLNTLTSAQGKYVTGFQNGFRAVGNLSDKLGVLPDSTKIADKAMKVSTKIANTTATAYGKVASGLNAINNANQKISAGIDKAGNAIAKPAQSIKNTFAGSSSNTGGQVGGIVGTTIILSELFTIEDDGTFTNDLIEKVRKGINNALTTLGLPDEKAKFGAKISTIIAGAIGSFAVISAVSGAITAMLGAVLASPIVLAAATVAVSAFIITSESELAEQLRALVMKTVEKAIYLPIELITGETLEENKKRNDNAIMRDLENDPLNSALITNQRPTSLRQLSIEKTQKALNKFKTELNELNEGNALSRLFNKGSIDAYTDAIERATTRLGNNQFEINRPIKKATGGYISGAGTATSDSIPAMLSNGEYVMKASSVSKFGTDFMAKINAGIMPQFFNKGGNVGLQANIDTLIGEQNKDIAKLRSFKGKPSSDNGFTNGLTTADQYLYDALAINIAERANDIADLQGQLKANSPDASASTADRKGANANLPAPKKTSEDGLKVGMEYAESFKQRFNQGLSDVLHGKADTEDFLKGLLDQYTSNVINSVVDGFTENLFKGISGEGGSLTDFFGKMFDFGSTTKDGMANAISQGTESGGGLTSLFKGLGDTISGAFSNISSMISGFGSGGGGWGTAISAGLKIFGFSQGGVVPSTSFSQAGKDSVPAMLTPGEVVIPKNQVNQMNTNNNQQQQTVFNLKVVGNVDRETRRNIVKMMPQIAGGVNQINKENNFRG